MATSCEHFKWPYLGNRLSNHSAFGSGVGFSGSANQLALLYVGSNPRWRPAAMLENVKWPYLSNGSSDSLRVRFDVCAVALVGVFGVGEEYTLDWLQSEIFLVCDVLLVHVILTEHRIVFYSVTFCLVYFIICRFVHPLGALFRTILKPAQTLSVYL